MKFISLLPILTAGNKKKDGDRSVDKPFIASEVTEECSNQVPRKGGSFEAINNGSFGEINLDRYSNNTDCKHVVQADESCEEIRIKYRSVAVESQDNCKWDSFRFGWVGTNGFEVTPPRCHCFGDGCDSSILLYYDEYINEEATSDFTSDLTIELESVFEASSNTDNSVEVFEYVFYDAYDHIIGPDEFSVNSNSFTFFFRSDGIKERGHVMFDWECVRYSTTTEAPTTTNLM